MSSVQQLQLAEQLLDALNERDPYTTALTWGTQSSSLALLELIVCVMKHRAIPLQHHHHQRVMRAYSLHQQPRAMFLYYRDTVEPLWRQHPTAIDVLTKEYLRPMLACAVQLPRDSTSSKPHAQRASSTFADSSSFASSPSSSSSSSASATVSPIAPTSHAPLDADVAHFALHALLSCGWTKFSAAQLASMFVTLMPHRPALALHETLCIMLRQPHLRVAATPVVVRCVLAACVRDGRSDLLMRYVLWLYGHQVQEPLSQTLSSRPTSSHATAQSTPETATPSQRLLALIESTAPAAMRGEWMRRTLAQRRLSSPLPLQQHPLFCQACNKLFAKDTTFKAHLAGKTHKANSTA